MTDFTPRDVRRFSIYKSQHLVLTVADEPGYLVSTAAPPPGGPVAHPFVDARAFDPYSEGELGELLQASSDFDDFIQRLIHSGYDVAAQGETPPVEMKNPFRLEDARGIAGALWSSGGQFTTLLNQPEDNALTFDHATLTSYRDDCAEMLLKALQSTVSFIDLRRSLENAGFRLIPAAKYIL